MRPRGHQQARQAYEGPAVVEGSEGPDAASSASFDQGLHALIDVIEIRRDARLRPLRSSGGQVSTTLTRRASVTRLVAFPCRRSRIP